VGATFIVSGLLHESYVWSYFFLQHDEEERFTLGYGESLLFFSWKCCHYTGPRESDFALTNISTYEEHSSNAGDCAPGPLLMALPCGHLGLYFSDFAIGLPLIVRLD
jgi:hypothetical protein